MSDKKVKNVKLETSGMAVSVEAGMLRLSSSWSPEQFGIDESSIPNDATTGGRKLWDSWIPYRFRQFRDNANNLISKMSYKVGKLYFVPDSVALECLTRLRVIEDEYNAHKDYVVSNLDAISSEWMSDKPELHLTQDDYPSADHLRKSLHFVIDYHLISFPDESVFERMEAAAATQVLKDNEETMKKIRKEMQEKAAVFMSNCTGQLMSEALKVTSKLHEQLKRRKKLHQGTVKAFHDFFERFRLLNISGDNTLDGVLEAIKNELIATDGINFGDAAMETEERLSVALSKVMTMSTESVLIEAEGLMADVEEQVSEAESIDSPLIGSGMFMGGRV